MPLFVSTGRKMCKFLQAALTLSAVASKQLPDQWNHLLLQSYHPIITSGLSWEIVMMLLVQALHLKDGSAFNFPLILEHLL